MIDVYVSLEVAARHDAIKYAMTIAEMNGSIPTVISIIEDAAQISQWVLTGKRLP